MADLNCVDARLPPVAGLTQSRHQGLLPVCGYTLETDMPAGERPTVELDDEHVPPVAQLCADAVFLGQRESAVHHHENRNSLVSQSTNCCSFKETAKTALSLILHESHCTLRRPVTK